MEPKRASVARKTQAALLLFLVCLSADARTNGGPANQVRVTAIAHSVSADRVRVVVRLSASVQYIAGTANEPFRIFFDLRGARPATTVAARVAVSDSLVQRIRVGQYQPGITRMVLDLARPAPYTATLLTNPPRLVVDVLRTAPAPAPAIARDARSIGPQPRPLASSIPAPVAPGLIPEQAPPSPPQVTYGNGLLTIVANNSLLSEILQAVAARTGAMLDAPANLTNQRVAARLGPGPPRDVVAELLSGLDFIVVGASHDPDAIGSIILSPTTSAALPEPGARRTAPPPSPPPPPEESEEAAPPEPTPPATSDTQVPASPAGKAQVKTPEELLDELRKLQEQQPQQSQPPQEPPPSPKQPPR